MSRFVAFDVETPNFLNNRMSSIGISVLEDGEITQRFSSLINPETSFDYFNTRLTGISEEDVTFSPTFPEIWDEIEPIMSSGLIVAHNAPFDMSVLKRCLSDYGIFWKPYVRYICTVRMGRRLLPDMSHKLDDLCDYYGIPLCHHVASSDSDACALILRNYLEAGADVRDFIRTCKLDTFTD